MATNIDLLPLKSLDQLNKEWIASVLSFKMKSKISVESIEVTIPESKSGFLSDICFVNVAYIVENSKAHVPLFVKILPQHEEIVGFMKLGNLGMREASFYSHAGSEDFLNFCQTSGFAHPVPEVYWSCVKEDSLTLVLDDLNTKGYMNRLLPEGSSLKQVKSTFEAIAVIHAYGFATLKKHGKDYFYVDFNTGYLDDIVCSGLDILAKMYKGESNEDLFKGLKPLNKQMISTADNNPLIDTLVHGDLWAGNVMFTANDETACIFDWQFACISNPLCDITSMLLMSAEATVYEDHLEEVLECYWKSFTNASKKNSVEVPVTYENVLANLKNLWMHGFMFFSASLPDMMMNNKITETRVQKVVSFIEKQGVFSEFLMLPQV